MNKRLEAIKRVIEKRKARGAGKADIQRYKKSIASDIKNNELRQTILNL